jgi:hypothetical protein
MIKQENENHQSQETVENQQQNYYQDQGNIQENYNTDPRQFIPLWEQMGASTGGLIGRFIGLNFYAGASYLANFLSASPANYQGNPQYYGNQIPYNPVPKPQGTETLNNQQTGYFVTIQTEADNAEAIKKIITENNGQV